MIQIFNPFTDKNTLIGKNGDFDLTYLSTHAVIDDKLNGVFNLDFRIRIIKDHKRELYESIVEDAILKVKDEYGWEYFRIASIRKGLKEISGVARQVTVSELLNMWVSDTRPTNQTGQGALNSLFLGAGNTDFSIMSNITNTNTAYYQDMSLYEAIYSADNCFLKRWGGEVERQGFNFSINTSAGTDRGFQIRSRKNLQGFEAETNIEELCTRLVVKGYDTLKLDDFVDSPLIGNYSKPYTKVVKYEDVKLKTESTEEGLSEVDAKAELLRRAKEEFSKRNIDKLKAKYRINFVELSQTEEYKDFSIAQLVKNGDTITVVEEVNGIDIKVKAIGRKWDVLKQRRIETELSNYDVTVKPINLKDLLKELGTVAEGGSNAMSQYITAMLESGLANSHAIHRHNETLYMDTNDVNTAREVFRLNKNGLGFSSDGVYGEYTYGFTRDGKINASLIQTGTLTAILLRSLDGANWIDLSTGEINFTKGRILGDKLEINLDTGVITSTDATNPNYIKKIILSAGKLFSDEYIRISSEKGVVISYGSGVNEESRFSGYDWGSFIGGDKINIVAGNQANNTISLIGNVDINGSPIAVQVANLENAMLMQEGLI